MELITKAKQLVRKAVEEKRTMSTEEVEDLRLEIAGVRFHISEDLLAGVSSKRSLAELTMESVSAKEFADLMGRYRKEKGYSTSAAESYARNTIRMESSKAYKAKEKYLKAKDDESIVYQILKSLDQVANALSKRT